MKKANVEMKFEVGSGNVYADLGLPGPEKLQAKAALMHLVNAEIKRQRLTQEQAGSVVGLAQSDISNISRGRGRTYSMDKLLDVLHKLGVDTTIHAHGDAVDEVIPIYARI